MKVYLRKMDPIQKPKLGRPIPSSHLSLMTMKSFYFEDIKVGPNLEVSNFTKMLGYFHLKKNHRQHS